MIAYYDLKYNESPQNVARQIIEKGSIRVSSRHQRPHEEKVCSWSRFRYRFKNYSLKEFLETFGGTENNS